MPPGFMINPFQFSIEIFSTIIIAVLAMIIFYKTREIDFLSGKKSIKLFRYSFLFFGLAYIMRFLLMTSKATITLMDLARYLNRTTTAFITPFMVFFSLIAIMFLTTSLIKKIREKHNIAAYVVFIGLIISIISFLSQEIILVVLVQFFLVVTALIILQIQKTHVRRRKNKFHIIYVLLLVNWILSIVIFIPLRIMIPHEWMLIPHIISISIFSIILQKINKWIK